MSHMYAVKMPTGEFIPNILEISEGWAWAKLYSKKVFPRHVPQEFIDSKKKEGYQVVKLMERAE